MCIIFLAIDVHPLYSLVIASNRDEYVDRPTEIMSLRSINDGGPNDHQTDESQEKRLKRAYLAGKDLVGGGTWLDIDVSSMDFIVEDIDREKANNANSNTDTGNEERENTLKWAALTNFNGKNEKATHGKTSRGSLVLEYLDLASIYSKGENCPAQAFTSQLSDRGHEFNGFSLLAGDETGIYYCTNRGSYPPSSRRVDELSYTDPLPSGIHGLSNGLLDSAWPKIDRGKEMLQKICDDNSYCSTLEFHEYLMGILRDEWKPPDDQLPDLGHGMEYDRNLSSIFISEFDFLGREYGTRCSTTIVVDRYDGRVSVLERTWPSGQDRWFKFISKR